MHCLLIAGNIVIFIVQIKTIVMLLCHYLCCWSLTPLNMSQRWLKLRLADAIFSCIQFSRCRQWGGGWISYWNEVDIYGCMVRDRVGGLRSNAKLWPRKNISPQGMWCWYITSAYINRGPVIDICVTVSSDSDSRIKVGQLGTRIPENCQKTFLIIRLWNTHLLGQNMVTFLSGEVNSPWENMDPKRVRVQALLQVFT